MALTRAAIDGQILAILRLGPLSVDELEQELLGDRPTQGALIDVRDARIGLTRQRRIVRTVEGKLALPDATPLPSPRPSADPVYELELVRAQRDRVVARLAEPHLDPELETDYRGLLSDLDREVGRWTALSLAAVGGDS